MLHAGHDVVFIQPAMVALSVKIIVGIDPGLSGALAIYDLSRNAQVVDIIDMPTEAWGAEKRHINVVALCRWVLAHGADTAAIERVTAMPGGPERRTMGAASAFRFGMCFGEVRGALVACGLKIVDVPPAQWKDLFELRKRDKDEARTMAAALHPEAAQWLKRKKDVGRAESILIARWAAQNRWEH